MKPDLLEVAARLAARAEAFAVCTVVRREPPSSARVGDTALVTRDGDVFGWAGGGCTRSTLLREALRAIADGEPRLLSLSPDPDLVQRTGVVALPMTCKSGGTVELYVEPVLPVPRMVIFGRTPAARAAARIADAMGYRTEVIDPEADAGEFPPATRVQARFEPGSEEGEAHVLVATMDERDLEAIEAALRLRPAYLGVIASRKRFGELRDALVARGVGRDALDAIVAPAGMDIGARSPEEIALSVIAQIVERRRHRTAVQAATRARRESATVHEAIDPVCGMTVAVSGARHVAEVEGQTLYFCCAGCRTSFLADPARYRARSTPATPTSGMVAVSRSRGG
ncbi:MAG TPA: XdhC family protein [Burkholderiaceae bacterium]|nr:XdhC family protein [Burkholderiaceae bacterium]